MDDFLMPSRPFTHHPINPNDYSPYLSVRSGFVGVDGGHWWNAGINSYGWSSTAYADSLSYFQFFGFGFVHWVDDRSDRWYGFPLRCLAL